MLSRSGNFAASRPVYFSPILVWERTRPVSKEELAAVLWPEDLSPAWESGLNSLTSKLGSLLASKSMKEHGLSLSRGLGQYQIRLPADVWIDVEAGTSARTGRRPRCVQETPAARWDRLRYPHPSLDGRSCLGSTGFGPIPNDGNLSANWCGHWTA